MDIYTIKKGVAANDSRNSLLKSGFVHLYQSHRDCCIQLEIEAYDDYFLSTSATQRHETIVKSFINNFDKIKEYLESEYLITDNLDRLEILITDYSSFNRLFETSYNNIEELRKKYKYIKES